MTPAPAVLGAHHIALSVTDLEVSRRWWIELLGAREVQHEKGDAREAVVLALPGTRLLVGLVQHRDRTMNGFSPLSTGLDHVALEVATMLELERWVARLDELSVRHSGLIELPKGAIVNASDPDGVAVAFFWRAPGAFAFPEDGSPPG